MITPDACSCLVSHHSFWKAQLICLFGGSFLISAYKEWLQCQLNKEHPCRFLPFCSRELLVIPTPIQRLVASRHQQRTDTSRSHSYSPNFPATTQPRTESHSKPSLPWVAFLRYLLVAIGRAANPAGALPSLPWGCALWVFKCGLLLFLKSNVIMKNISTSHSIIKEPPLYVTD